MIGSGGVGNRGNSVSLGDVLIGTAISSAFSPVATGETCRLID